MRPESADVISALLSVFYDFHDRFRILKAFAYLDTRSFLCEDESVCIICFTSSPTEDVTVNFCVRVLYNTLLFPPEHRIFIFMSRIIFFFSIFVNAFCVHTCAFLRAINCSTVRERFAALNGRKRFCLKNYFWNMPYLLCRWFCFMIVTFSWGHKKSTKFCVYYNIILSVKNTFSFVPILYSLLEIS